MAGMASYPNQATARMIFRRSGGRWLRPDI